LQNLFEEVGANQARENDIVIDLWRVRFHAL